MKTGIKVILTVGLCVVSGAALASDTWTKLGFHGASSRLYTGDGIWADGDIGECASSGNDLIAGVASSNTNGSYNIWGNCSHHEFTDAILCSSSIGEIDVRHGHSLYFWNVDDRRDTSMGDWAPNLFKGECGPTEGMTGLDQGTDGSLAQGMCRPIIGNQGARDCSVLYFANGNAQESTTRGDWDFGYRKGECSPGRYVKGVAHGGDSVCGSRSKAILCCSPTF